MTAFSTYFRVSAPLGAILGGGHCYAQIKDNTNITIPMRSIYVLSASVLGGLCYPITLPLLFPISILTDGRCMLRWMEHAPKIPNRR